MKYVIKYVIVVYIIYVLVVKNIVHVRVPADYNLLVFF